MSVYAPGDQKPNKETKMNKVLTLEQWQQDLLEELRLEAEGLAEKRRKHDKEYAEKLGQEWISNVYKDLE